MLRRRRRGEPARHPARSAVRIFGASIVLLALCVGCTARAFADTTPLPASTSAKQNALDAEYAIPDEGSASGEGTFPDPLENVNRKTLFFNRQLDRFLLDPITRVYRFVVPDPAKRAVRRAFSNLGATSIMVNDLLQREWKDAGVAAGRFVLNSTFGMAGFVDVAAEMGLEEHHSDFGQTLALMGVSSGPFLIVPILGPMTVRDGTGYVVDLFFRPTTWLFGPANFLFLDSPFLFGPGEQFLLNTIQTGSSGIANFEEHSEDLKRLEDSSVDYYAALRNAYFQNRTAEIWGRREHHRAGSAESETRSAETTPADEHAG